MVRKRIRYEDIPVRKHPGDLEPFPGSPGSIEQHLDMCENTDAPRGDDVLHTHGGADPGINTDYDMSTEDREGDEMSGDDHSSGLQGEEGEIADKPRGVPGDETVDDERELERIRRQVAS